MPQDKDGREVGMALHVGTSGWAYPAWKPLFYPEKLAQKKFLPFYSSRLNAVEVNYSFRQFIKESTLQNWIGETPDGFAFCVKAHQSITHIRRLKNAETSLTRFLESIQPLAAKGKLGPALFQLPPKHESRPGAAGRVLRSVPKELPGRF